MIRLLLALPALLLSTATALAAALAPGWPGLSSVTDLNGHTSFYAPVQNNVAVAVLLHGGTQPALDLTQDIEYRQLIITLLKNKIAVVVPESTNVTQYSWYQGPFYDNVNTCNAGQTIGCPNLDTANINDLLANKIPTVVNGKPICFQGFSNGAYAATVIGEQLSSVSVTCYALYNSIGHYCEVPGGIKNSNDTCTAPGAWTKPIFYRAANNDNVVGNNAVSACNPTTATSRVVCHHNSDTLAQEGTIVGLGATGSSFNVTYQRQMAPNYLTKTMLGAAAITATDAATIFADMQNAGVVGTAYIDANGNWLSDPLMDCGGIGCTPPSYPGYSARQASQNYTEALCAYAEHRYCNDYGPDLAAFILAALPASTCTPLQLSFNVACNAVAMALRLH